MVARRRAGWILGGLLAAGALVHCASEPQGHLRLGLYVNDLVIPEDTNLMGLYLAELRQDGRTGTVHAFEAAPLREGGRTIVPFPATLRIDSGELTTRVHVRLVAFHVAADGTRKALTMREARTAVPRNDDRLLRLSLFWHGIGNVVDAGAGQGVVSPTGFDVAVANEIGTTSVARFSQFRAVCNGAPAAEGQTAAADGRCIPVDTDTGPDDASAPLPESTEGEACFDAAAAFAVPGTTPADLTSRLESVGGACSVQIPAAMQGALWNVALRSTSGPGFPMPALPAATEHFLRPLPLGSAARREGDRLVLPAVACAELVRLATDAQLLLAPNPRPWAGGLGVCSEWNTATTKVTEELPSIDGGLPELPGLDATLPDVDVTLPDVSLPDVFNPAERVDIERTYTGAPDFSFLDGLAAAGGEAVLTTRQGQARILRMPSFATRSGTEVLPAHTSVSADYPIVPRVVQIGASHEFYVEAKDQAWGAGWVSPDGAVLPLTPPSNANVHVVQLAPAVGAVFSGDAALTVNTIASSVPPTSLGPNAVVTLLVSSDAPLGHVVSAEGRIVGSVRGDEKIRFIDCVVVGQVVSNCLSSGDLAPEELPTEQGMVTGMAASALGVFALVRSDIASGTHLLRLGARGSIGTLQEATLPLSTTELVAGPSHVCFVEGESDAVKIRCRTAVASAQTTPFLGSMRDAVLAADDQYLYAAYRCPSQTDIHVRRVQWSTVVTGNIPSGCP